MPELNSSGFWTVGQAKCSEKTRRFSLVSIWARISRTTVTQERCEISGKKGLEKVVEASRMVRKAKSRYTNKTQRGLSSKTSLKVSCPQRMPKYLTLSLHPSITTLLPSASTVLWHFCVKWPLLTCWMQSLQSYPGFPCDSPQSVLPSNLSV